MSKTVRLATMTCLIVLVACFAGCPGQPEPTVTPKGAPPEKKAEEAPADKKTGAAAEEELMILCGSSFSPPMEKLCQMFEKETGKKAVLSFGGSEDLLPQVKLKSNGDLFVTHDPYMDYTKQADALLRWVQVGNLAPVLVVRKGNPKGLKKIEDLTKEGLEVLLPNPEFSTCGEMVFALLEKKGIKDAVLKNVGNRMFRSHADIGNKMQLSAGDAAIMWNGVAHNFVDKIDIVPVPYEYEKEIRVGVIGLSYSEKKDRVEEFLKFVDEHGTAVFKEFGYVK